jgi:hypothetical protein
MTLTIRKSTAVWECGHDAELNGYTILMGELPEKHLELPRRMRENNIVIVVYLVKARTVEPEKQPLLGNARTQQ